MLNNRIGILLMLFVTIATSSCSNYNKILKSNDLELKYKAAKEYYNKKDYVKAAPLFDELLVAFKGDNRFEEIYFYYAYCRYGMGEIVIASYHFYNFYESFPTSVRAEEALYMHVYCDYLDSYPYYLDPSVTQKAMNSLQLFINVYPLSTRVADCNKYMDELRGRLRKKSLESAYLYLRIEDYKAATIAFKNTLKDYPELENKAEVEFLIVKCSYLLALNSVEDRKEERFRDVCKAYNEYVENNGTSDKHHDQALSYNNRSLRMIRYIPVRHAETLFSQKRFEDAVVAYRKCLNIPEIEGKEQIYFGLVKSYQMAAATAEGEEKKIYLRAAVAEADVYIGTYGEQGPSYKKVKKIRESAEKELQGLN